MASTRQLATLAGESDLPGASGGVSSVAAGPGESTNSANVTLLLLHAMSYILNLPHALVSVCGTRHAPHYLELALVARISNRMHFLAGSPANQRFLY